MGKRTDIHYEFEPEGLQVVSVYVNGELTETYHEASRDVSLGEYTNGSVINIKVVGSYKFGRKVIVEKDLVVLDNSVPLPSGLPSSNRNRHSIAVWATRCTDGLIIYVTGGPFGVVGRTHETEVLTSLPKPPDSILAYYTHTVVEIPSLGVTVTKRIDELLPGDSKQLVSRIGSFVDIFCPASVPSDLMTVTVKVTNHYTDEPPATTEAVVYIGQSYPYTALSS